MTVEEFNQNLIKIGEGDNAGLKAIYEEYYSTMCMHAYILCKNRTNAEDIASEVLLKIAELRVAEYIKNPAAYIHAMVNNATLTMINRDKRVINDLPEVGVSNYDFYSNLGIEEVIMGLPEIERCIVIEHVFY